MNLPEMCVQFKFLTNIRQNHITSRLKTLNLKKKNTKSFSYYIVRCSNQSCIRQVFKNFFKR